MLENSPLSTNRALYLVGGVGEFGRIHSGFYYVSFFFLHITYEAGWHGSERHCSFFKMR